jgi:hypothetical protein
VGQSSQTTRGSLRQNGCGADREPAQQVSASERLDRAQRSSGVGNRRHSRTRPPLRDSDDLPRKRIGDPAQLDSTLLYLAAPASEFVTGTVVKVDDGQFPAEPIQSRSDLSRGTRTVPQSVLSALGGWERAESYWAS